MWTKTRCLCEHSRSMKQWHVFRRDNVIRCFYEALQLLWLLSFAIEIEASPTMQFSFKIDKHQYWTRVFLVTEFFTPRYVADVSTVSQSMSCCNSCGSVRLINGQRFPLTSCRPFVLTWFGLIGYRGPYPYIPKEHYNSSAHSFMYIVYDLKWTSVRSQMQPYNPYVVIAIAVCVRTGYKVTSCKSVGSTPHAWVIELWPDFGWRDREVTLNPQ